MVKHFPDKLALALHKSGQGLADTSLMIEAIGLDGYPRAEFAALTGGRGHESSIALS
tara:strand:+ start:86 stop:256 length:171 start_codon:yes stop_codon:yes gene_type:complete